MKQQKINPLKITLILTLWCILGAGCFLLESMVNLNVWEGITVDMAPIPLGAYDIQNASARSTDNVTKLFLVPMNTETVMRFYEYSLPIYGWASEGKKENHIFSDSEEPITSICIRAQRFFVVLYINIYQKGAASDNLSFVTISNTTDDPVCLSL